MFRFRVVSSFQYVLRQQRQVRFKSTMPFTVPKTQKAQVYDKYNGAFEYREIPVPEPGPLDILVNVKYTGVCHTDLHVWEGDFADVVKAQFPLVGGHEGLGYVVAKGSQVTNFDIGDVAGIKWVNSSCLACEMCKRGFEPNCVDSKNSGLHVNGTFQQYALVRATEAPKLPKDIDMPRAAPILCAGLTVYRALKEANVFPGEFVAVTGAGGGLGSLAIQYGHAMGMRVIAIDVGAERGEHCLALGATHYVDVSSKTPEEIIAEMQHVTEGGPHGVVHVAPASAPFLQAAKYVRARGTIVIVSLPKDTPIGADTVDTVLRVITIKGSYVGNREDMDEAIGFFSRGEVSAPVKMGKLSELGTIIDDMKNGKLIGRVVLDNDK